MISYREALDIIAASIEPLAAASLRLAELAGATAAADATAAMQVPPFDNAAMDGFAVRAAETAGASADHPCVLRVAGTSAAGSAPPSAPGSGLAVEIMTGAPMPAGYDAVIPVERAETGSGQEVCFRAAAAVGQNVRRAGEDYPEGAVVIRSGQPVEPHLVMGLAATGIDRIKARRAPRVCVITTGSELASDGVPAQPGMIRDANGPYLKACVPRVGGELVTRLSIQDDVETLTATLDAQSNNADIVLTTGAVSAGRFDFVPACIREIGGEILFHHVAVRPGKPLLFARLPGGGYLFGLPGNPIAVATGLRFFVAPAIRALQGREPERFVRAIADGEIKKRAGLRFFAKARCRVDDGGRLRVVLLPGQESFRIAPLADASAWAVIPEGTERLAAGEPIAVAPLYPDGFLPSPS